jgi:lysosomal alpha-mannosidase
LELGPIPNSGQGQEVTINFWTPDVDNKDTFYTDSNGLEMQKRVLNYRPTWNFTSKLNVTQNYYPINSAIAIKDLKKRT